MTPVSFYKNNRQLSIGIALFLLALGVRFAALLALKNSLYYDVLLWDEHYYHSWAVKIAAGEVFSSSVYEYAPLPAYVAALLYKLFSVDVFYVRLFNVFLGSASCVVVYFISRHFMPTRWSLVASLLTIFCRELTFFSTVPLKTSLAVFLLSLMVLFLLSLRAKYSIGKVILLGLVLGLFINVRPNVVVFVPLLCLYLLYIRHGNADALKKGIGSVGLFLCGVFIALSPFIIRNYQVSGIPAILPSQSGFLLYAANNPNNKSPYYQPVSFASSHPYEQGIHFTVEAARRMGGKVDSGEAAKFWRNIVVRDTLEEPDAALDRIGGKVLALLSFSGMDDHYHIPFLTSVVPFLALPFAPYWLLASLGCSFLLAAAFRSEQAAILGLMVISYWATLVIFSPGLRFQVVLLPIFIPMAVLFVKMAWSMHAEGECYTFTMAALVFSILLVFGFIPLEATHDRSLAFNTHAYVLDRHGREEEALKYWRRSSRLDQPFSAVANLFLAGKLYHSKGIEKSLFYLDKISDDSFMAAAKHLTLGDLFKHQDTKDRALQAYYRSISINSGQRRVRREIIDLLAKKDPQEAEKQRAVLQGIEAYY